MHKAIPYFSEERNPPYHHSESEWWYGGFLSFFSETDPCQVRPPYKKYLDLPWADVVCKGRTSPVFTPAVIVNANQVCLVVKRNTGTSGVRCGAQRALLALHGQ